MEYFLCKRHDILKNEKLTKTSETLTNVSFFKMPHFFFHFCLWYLVKVNLLPNVWCQVVKKKSGAHYLNIIIHIKIYKKSKTNTYQSLCGIGM
jgi:hypothetical protein